MQMDMVLDLEEEINFLKHYSNLSEPLRGPKHCNTIKFDITSFVVFGNADGSGSNNMNSGFISTFSTGIGYGYGSGVYYLL